MALRKIGYCDSHFSLRCFQTRCSNSHFLQENRVLRFPLLSPMFQTRYSDSHIGEKQGTLTPTSAKKQGTLTPTSAKKQGTLTPTSNRKQGTLIPSSEG